jgi:hypothetical protein
MGGAMKAMKHGMIWVLVGLGLAMLLTVGVLGSAQSVSALDTDPVLVGAGDIASCDRTGDEDTASLLEGLNGTAVATLGDNAYESGTALEFSDCYNPSWGRLKARTMPSVGNHEYYDLSGVAQPYFDYFSAKNGFQLPAAPVPNDPGNDNNHGLTVGEGYYSYDLGSWHVVVLNSNCSFVAGGGCAAGSDQEQWLKADLKAHLNACTLAYWHHPRFSSSGIGNNSAVAPFWDDLYQAGAEVVLNGHAHNYERFAPQTPDGQLDQAQGIREFVVGTGGRSLNSFSTTRNNSEVRITDDYVNVTDGLGKGKFGVIKLTLHPGSYEWKFVQIDGTVDGMDRDPGSASCHGEPTSTTDPVPGPPAVISTSPATIATTANVTATFSEEMKASSIITPAKTFKLFKKGSTTKIDATVTYPDPNSPSYTAKLDPKNSLDPGVTYKAVVTTGAMDTVGNPLPQNYKWFFTTAR